MGIFGFLAVGERAAVALWRKADTLPRDDRNRSAGRASGRVGFRFGDFPVGSFSDQAERSCIRGLDVKFGAVRSGRGVSLAAEL